MKRLILLSLLLTLSGQAAQAGPKRILKALGQQVKQTFYTDIKQHPVAWGLNLGLQLGINMADATTTCLDTNVGVEAGPARLFIGRYPNCKKTFLFMIAGASVHAVAEDWLMNAFTD